MVKTSISEVKKSVKSKYKKMNATAGGDGGGDDHKKGEDLNKFRQNVTLIVLPPEIWDNILQFLTTVDDLQSAARATPLWNQLLQRQKPTFLFPKCLPNLINYLDGTTVIRLRQVCKTWRGGVDFLLQNGPHLRRTPPSENELMPLERVPRDHRIFSETLIKFKNLNQIRRFIMQMRPRVASNPFPGRSVHFAPTTSRVQANELVQYEAQLRQFLALFGTHLWRFQYKLPIYETPNEGRNNLVGILNSLPHVKTVHFEDGYHWLNTRVLRGGQEGRFLIGENDQRDDAHDMLMVLMDQPVPAPLPFPSLPDLVEINVPNQSLFHGDYLDNLAQAYGSQVLSIQWINTPFMANMVIFRVNERFRRVLNFGDDDQEEEADNQNFLIQVEELENDRAGNGGDEVDDFFENDQPVEEDDEVDDFFENN